MIKSAQLVKIFKKNGFGFITGVPCSIFKDFLVYLNQVGKIRHIPATSEGEACALGTGYHLSTGKIPLIYMQNSGLGNAVNPLTSLLDKEVYGIPALLLVSWRGEPGKTDEPEHIKMGKITTKMLALLGIPYLIVSEKESQIEEQINKAKQYFERNSSPFALIFKNGIIEPEHSDRKKTLGLTREEAIKAIIDKLKGNEAVVSTTGKTSRELFECRENKKQGHQPDFYMVGSMGSSSALSLGVALNSRKKVLVIDGDGSVLMKMGNLATIGQCQPKKFIHIVMDNSGYESTGGQPSSSSVVDWEKLFLSLGYKKAVVIKSKKELDKLNFDKIKSPAAIIIKCNQESRKDLGRPTLTPVQVKENFMKFLSD